MGRIGEAFAQALKQMLKEKKEPSIDTAAKHLGVTRQAFHAYLNGKLPRQDRLDKAMRMWKLKLDLKEHSYDWRDFGGSKQQKTSEWHQLSLFEALDTISGDDLQVNVKRTGRALRVNVVIELPA